MVYVSINSGINLYPINYFIVSIILYILLSNNVPYKFFFLLTSNIVLVDDVYHNDLVYVSIAK